MHEAFSLILRVWRLNIISFCLRVTTSEQEKTNKQKKQTKKHNKVGRARFIFFETILKF